MRPAEEQEQAEVAELARLARVCSDDDALIALIERTEPPNVESLIDRVFPGRFRSAVTPQQFNRLNDHLELCADFREHARLSAAS